LGLRINSYLLLANNAPDRGGGGEVIYEFARERGKEKGEGSQGPQGDWESVRQGGEGTIGRSLESGSVR